MYQPPTPAPGPPPATTRRTAWLVAGGVTGLVLLIGAITTTIAVLSSGDGDPPTGPGPGAAASPVAAPSTAPADEPVPEIVTDGAGPETVPVEMPEGRVAVVAITYTAASEAEPFAVYVVGADGEEFPFHVRNGSHDFIDVLSGPPSLMASLESLRFDGAGTWSLHLRDLEEAPAWPVTEGEGSTVLRVEPLDGPVPVTAVHEGYFSVGAYVRTSSPTGPDFVIEDQLVVEFDGGTSSFTIPEDTAALRISAEGEWTIELS